MCFYTLPLLDSDNLEVAGNKGRKSWGTKVTGNKGPLLELDSGCCSYLACILTRGVTVHKIRGSVCTSVLGLMVKYDFGTADKKKGRK